MGTFIAACIQMRSGVDPAENAARMEAMVRDAAAQGARYIQTPEMTGAVQRDRKALFAVLRPESEDLIAATAARLAGELNVFLHVGSTAIAVADGRIANRAFLFGPDGGKIASYDKIHMFDVDISETERYRESAAYRPGEVAVLAPGPVPVGMTICYDLRFPGLFRDLAQAGARILTVPSAFNPTSGAAHWHVLLRARAIETGCFVLAPAQTGQHPAPHSPDRAPRHSFGHSLAVDPWGEVLTDAGTDPGYCNVMLDLTAVGRARSRIPSLTHDRIYARPPQQ